MTGAREITKKALVNFQVRGEEADLGWWQLRTRVGGGGTVGMPEIFRMTDCQDVVINRDKKRRTGLG